MNQPKLILTVAFLIALVAFGGASGQTAKAASLRVHHKPYNKMTRNEVITTLKKQLHKDHSVIRFWKNHDHLRKEHRWIYHIQIHWARISLKVAGRNLQKLTASSVVTGSDISAWLCIHKYEGSWSDPNSPYWGGLQMDMGFQETYGSEFLHKYGTADHWPIIDQIIAARRARDGYNGYGPRGYSPWPNTARLCGLL